MEKIYSWQLDAILIILRYILFAGTAYSIFYLWKNHRLQRMKINKSRVSINAVKREIVYSAITLLIYSGGSWLMYDLYHRGYTKIYTGNEHGPAYFVFSVVFMVMIHDAYFYWTHRWLHIPWVFKKIHKIHHLSHNPTPWAAFAFHPLEAVVAFGIVPLIVFLVPSHPLAVFFFLSYMTLINVMGHSGYEIFPGRFSRNVLGRWQNSATNHHFHHEKAKHNYGLYFTFWDVFMKTFRKRDTE